MKIINALKVIINKLNSFIKIYIYIDWNSDNF